MRLSSTVLGRFRGFRPDSDAFWNTHPPRLRIGARLRRILEHRESRSPVSVGVLTTWGGRRCDTSGALEPPARTEGELTIQGRMVSVEFRMA